MEVKDNIVKGAAELFMKRGIKSSTMDDIAAHVGMSKRTIYQHFKDKNELVLTVAGKIIAHDCQMMENISNRGLNAVEELVETTRMLRAIMQRTHGAVVHDLKKYHAAAWGLFREMKENHMHNQIMDNMKRGIEEGFYRPEINTKVLTRLRMEEVEMTFDHDVFPPHEFDYHEVPLQIMDHFVRGILTPKGCQLWDEYQKEG